VRRKEGRIYGWKKGEIEGEGRWNEGRKEGSMDVKKRA
jgi:hypothetical protein